MCGIVGLFLKRKSREPRLGELFSEMLDCMSSRGPDSAGLAIYGDTVPAGSLKLTLQHPAADFSWDQVAQSFERKFKTKVFFTVNSTHAIFTIAAREPAIRRFLHDEFPELKVMSIGRRIEIMKEIGTPASVMDRFNVAKCAAATPSATRAWRRKVP